MHSTPRKTTGLYLIAGASQVDEQSRMLTARVQRLHAGLSDEHQGMLGRAMNQADMGLGGGHPFQQDKLDKVLSLVRQAVPDITLRLFARAEETDLGLIGYAAINSDTLGQALAVMNAYHGLASNRYIDQLEIQDEQAVISPTPLPGYEEDFQNIVEDSLAGNWRSLGILLGEAADQEKTAFNFDYPRPAWGANYEEVFGSNCHFAQARSELRFPAAWLDVPINRSGGGLAQVFTAMCERILGHGQTGADTSELVQRLLLSRRGRRMPRLEDTAAQLFMSANKLRKRLYRMGTTYKALVLRTRMELASHYLLDTQLSVQEIAYLLDYASPAPFSRAFKRYFGLAPEHYRLAQNAQVSFTPGTKSAQM